MVRKRGKRWVAVVYDRTTGGKRHLGTFDTRREASAAVAEWELRSKPTGRETCDHFAARWTRDYPRPHPATNLHNAERVKRFISDFAGVKLGDVDRAAARAWVLQHKSHLPAVRAMFNDALGDGLITTNPFTSLRIPGTDGRKRITTLTETELEALAGLAHDPRMRLGEFAVEYRAMVLFAGYVGLRPGELFALRRDDVRGQIATIDRAFSSKTREEGPMKGVARSRDVIVPPPAQDALASVPQHADGLLFAAPSGRRWTQPSHHRYWDRLRIIANRPGFDFYELRHAAATMLLARGVTPWDVAVQLGHDDGGQLVMELYGHPTAAGSRARILAAWDQATGPEPIRSVARREQAS